MAEALYRKYRPQIFEDVVGQEHIERTLKNAIESDKVSHAYLFTGPRGTGKTTTARLLAKALLCQQGPTPDPDGTCEDCNLVAAGEHPDVYELDAASRTGVENVREEIIGRVNYAPTRGKYKIYIIDEVHMLSTAAFNALLKTLEEPPAHVVFVLCTTDPQKVPETIHSRCQRFDFRRISNEELVSRLGAICEMEGIEFEGDALELIAHRADGGMRDALTSLEQLAAFGEDKISMQLAERLLGGIDSSELADIVQAIGTRNVAAAFCWVSTYMETGADLAQFTQDLAAHMRDMYVMQLAGADVALDITEAARRELQSELAWFGGDRLSNMLGVLGDLMKELKTSTNQRLSFEIALTRMMRPDSDLTLASLAERIEALEAGYSASANNAVGLNAATGTSAPLQGQGQPQPQTRVEGTTSAVAQNATSVQQTQTSNAAQSAQPAAAENHLNETAAVDASSQMAESDASNAASANADIAADAATTNPVPALDARNFQQFWQTAMAYLKKANQAYAVLLMNTKAALDGASIAITFPADTEFAFLAVQKPEVKDAIAQSLAQAGCPGLAFSFQKASADSPKAQSANVGSPAVNVASANLAAPATIAQTETPAVQPEAAQQTETAAAQTPAVQPTAVPQTFEGDVASQVVPEPDPVPYEDIQPVSAPAPEPEFEPVGTPDLPEVSNSEPATASDTQDANDAEPAVDELSDMLSAAFGEGITLTQIDE